MARIPEIKNTVNTDWSYSFCLYESDFNIQDMSDNVEIDFLAGVEVSDFESIPTGMTTKLVPTQKYAVFTSDNSRKIYNYIYGDWARNSGYELAETDDFECYDLRYNPGDLAHSRLEIYVPIK